jgi:exo-beta-1,3-glucanase (GH17 family)
MVSKCFRGIQSVLMRIASPAVVLALSFLPPLVRADTTPDQRFPLFTYLTGSPTPSLVAYTPSQLDPRQEVNQRRLATSSIRADLEALRQGFDGLVLYGYHEACTPRILAVAKDLKYRAVLLGVWDPRSAAELDGVAKSARQHVKDFSLGVLLGNEGITFRRYEVEDLTIAAARLRGKLPKGVPLATSEPLVGYRDDVVRGFGDFLAPNIHPVFDRPKLGPEEAATWAREQAADLARQARRPVVLKETGFPHGGKEPYSPRSQEAFWAAYTKQGVLARPADSPEVWAFHGIAFEAFDLPWKAEESKLPIEGSWGLLSAKREPYPALAVWRAGLRGGGARRSP